MSPSNTSGVEHLRELLNLNYQGLGRPARTGRHTTVSNFDRQTCVSFSKYAFAVCLYVIWKRTVTATGANYLSMHRLYFHADGGSNHTSSPTKTYKLFEATRYACLFNDWPVGPLSRSNRSTEHETKSIRITDLLMLQTWFYRRENYTPLLLVVVEKLQPPCSTKPLC